MFEKGDSFIDLAVGTMDDPNKIENLDSQIGMESRVHWFATLHKLPERSTDETRPIEEIIKLKSLQHPDQNTDIWPPKNN